MEIDTALSKIELKYDFTFKKNQLTAINSIIDNKDTFIVLPTGYGKSKIYVHLPEIYKLVNNVQGTVLVISPLQSLMTDQVTKLDKLKISSTVFGESQLDKSVASWIMDGTFSIVFSSPEAALTPGFWRRCFTSGKFHDNFQAVVVDEAHCMTEWYVLYIYLTLSRLLKHTNIASLQHENLSLFK
jgi:superfamily II DNA helicase RecQ